ncbi:MAG: hypothetical protein JWL62_3439 [Hyphomicrobiales bacterium]|nr:hypothetical protein [Hyphomicrobiales bacterium]
MVDQTQDKKGRFGRWTGRTPVAATDDACVLLRPTRRRLRRRTRLAILCASIVAALVLFVAVSAALFYARIAQGPIAVDSLNSTLAAALKSRMGKAYSFVLGSMQIEKTDDGPALSVAGFAMNGAGGRPIIAAPKAEVSVDPLSLLFGAVSPRRLEVFDVEVRLSVMPDGAVAISAGSEPIVLTQALMPGAEAAPSAAPDAAPALVRTAVPRQDAMHQLGEALKSLLDSATSGDSPLGALERLGISRGRLVFDDQTAHQVTVFDGLELSFDKTSAGVHLLLSARGPNGRWQVEASATGRPGETRKLDLDLRDITLDEIALVLGLRDPGFDFDMPLTSKLQVTLGEDGNLSTAEGHFGAGAGFFFLHDPDHEPVQVDEITGQFRWNAASRRFDLDSTQFFAGETHFVVGGTVTPPAAPGDGWRIEGGTVAPSMFGTERPNQKPIALDHATLAANLFTDSRRLVLTKLELAGPDVNFSMEGEADVTDAGPHVRLSATGGKMPASSVVRLWPSAVAPEVRAWFITNLQGGTVEGANLRLDFDADAIAAVRAKGPPPDPSIRLDFNLSNMSARILPGIPPLSGLDGSGVVTGHTSNFVATRGLMEVSPNQKLNLVEGSFSVPDTGIKPTPAAINVRLTGNLDTLADLFDRDALKPYAQLPIDNTTVKGLVDGRVAIDMKLGKNVTPDDTAIRASATLTNFSVDRLVGKEKLDAATLNLTAERGTLRASGQGRMFGAPATIELRKPQQGPTEAVIGMTLDDAARNKLGMNFGPSLTGQIGARMTAVLGQSEKSQAQVEIDFTRAAIDNLLPGYTKAAGKAAKASFLLINDTSGPDLEQFVFDGGTASAKGQIKLDPAGAFLSAKLSQLRLSPGDDMKVDADQTKDGLRLAVRGTTIDARPLIKLVATGMEGTGREKSAPQKDIDVELKAGLVTGNNKQALSGVEMKLSRRAGIVRQFQLNGRFGRESVSGSMARPASGGLPQLSITTNDGGALLSFFDFYKRMEGGRLSFLAQISDGRIDGLISVRDFIVRNEPALRRLVTEGVAARDRTGQIKIDTTAASFTKMQVNFTRGDGRIEMRDGVIFGPQVGTTMEGVIDTLNDRVSMTGTFVPAYGLNNLFSKIPIFGIILGGGSNEGLFGVNYRISGPASAPVLTINPLSAIAPGFLRKIFGAGEIGTEQYPQAATPAAPAAAAPMQYAPGRR